MEKGYLILFLAFIVSSCSSQVTDPDGKVGSDIKIILREEISTEGRYLVIKSETFEIFKCYNYHLMTQQNFQENEIIITYSGVSKPEICATALGPAQSSEFLSVENGIYSVTFINDGVTNKGQLTVDAERYVLELQDPRNVFVENGVVSKTSSTTD